MEKQKKKVMVKCSPLWSRGQLAVASPIGPKSGETNGNDTFVDKVFKK